MKATENPSAEKQALEFLELSDQFRLGHLETEASHPGTVGLSQMTHLNLEEAIRSFVKVDEGMLHQLVANYKEIFELTQKIEKVFKNKGRLFLSGCGATGRLSLVIENIWRQSYPDAAKKVVAFMAGGDLALIHSIEKFEDYPDYGARQLRELGFTENDYLIASTEGGETPWVIGTALEAIKIGGGCSFLFCNQKEALSPKLKRCQEVFEEERIHKLELATGPQALTGSTRLQASSILTAAIGAALFQGTSEKSIFNYLSHVKDWYLNLNHKYIIPLIKKEAELIKSGTPLYYAPGKDLAISVLTDTTERSPTFSLNGFDNKLDENSSASWCYLAFPRSATPEEAWEKLLLRPTRTLEWEEVKEKAGRERLLGFDFSREVFQWRKEKVPEYEIFGVVQKEDRLLFELGEEQVFFPLPKNDRLASHLILKMLLNMHSTLLMGLLERYESNIMTYVRPSNYKLMDRAARYAGELLSQKGYEVPYETLVKRLFELKESTPVDEPLVLKLVHEFSLQ